MEKQPVGQLPDLTQSNNDDEIMVITNSEYNQLKKEKISDFITDLQSTNTNNSLTTGSDGKLFVSKTINASDVDGVLSLDNIPQLTTNKLPETGISADNYTYPSSITVNDRGQVVSIVEGSPAEAGAYLDQSQITNCILEAPNGVATYSGSTITVKQGLKVLIPNGRNADGTLKNIEYTVPEDKTINYAGVGDKTYDFTLLYGNTNDWALSQNYQEADTPPAFNGYAQYYLNTKENIMYFNNNNERWEPKTVAVLGKGRLENGVIVSFTPFNPVELAKDTDVVHNTGDENIEGFKTFEEDLCTVQNVRPIAKAAGKGSFVSEYNFVPTTAAYPSVTLKLNTISIPDENIPVSTLGRFCCTDSQGWIIGGIQVRLDTVNTPITDLVARAYRNGADKVITAQLSMDANGNGTFEFPRCTARPSTTSTAANNRVAVVVQNYLNGTTGAIKFSDGLIMQWGTFIPTSVNVAVTITYKLPFSNANYSLSCTRISTRPSSSHDRENMPNSKNSTGFTIWSNTGINLVASNWFAIGY